MALHTGEAEERDGDYFGPALNRVARILAAAHGGQLLLSQATEERIHDALPEGASVRDLGVHRLRDLTRSERIFQLLHPNLTAEFPPLRSLEAFAHNLPIQLTSFIGRERELAEVKRLLTTNRLLTLTGVGGCGKTRLALQVAADLVAEYADGVWLVELAALADPSLVTQAITSVFGVREEPRRPLMETLANYLRPRQLLLVLDNCEHLLAGCAALADPLLRNCPNLRILATSREVLGVAGEIPWRVPSLSLPDPEGPPPTEAGFPSVLRQYEATSLFIERAQTVRPGFAVTPENARAVVQVCHRLDGIPLGLELAAARVKVLPVEEIAVRLDDRFRLLTGGSRTALPRQQTLRALIDWSYDLLSPQERLLFRRLSVFAGGWTLEAAEAVCAGDGIEDWEALDLLEGLVDKSLVLYEERDRQARYRFLETVRQYARERLLESGESDVVCGRHLGFFLQLAEAAAPHLFLGVRDKAWLEQLVQENENLRTAFEWCEAEESRVEASLRLAAGLHWFWFTVGYFCEGKKRLARALCRSQHTPPSTRAKALTAAGYMAWWQGDYEAIPAPLEESLVTFRRLDDRPSIAYTLCGLGAAAYLQGDPTSARFLLQEAVELARSQEDRILVSFALYQFGLAAQSHGDYAGARSSFEEGLAISREAGHRTGTAFLLCVLGRLTWARGDSGAARACYVESLTAFQELGNRHGTAVALLGLAYLAAAHGHLERAAHLAGAVEALHEAIGARVPVPPHEREEYDRNIAAMRAAIGEAAFAAAWAAGRAMPLAEAVAFALEMPGP
jgi:predicted ATPase